MVILVPAWGDDAQKSHAWFLKYFPLVIHPTEPRLNEYYTHDISGDGLVALGVGAVGGVDIYNEENSLGIRFMQGLYEDCAGLFSGFTHLGFRHRLIDTGTQNLYWGIGPTFIFRENWRRFPNYEGHRILEDHGKWEYALIWYGGEIEYNYRLSEDLEFSVTLIPAVPDLIMLGFGVKVWF